MPAFLRLVTALLLFCVLPPAHAADPRSSRDAADAIAASAGAVLDGDVRRALQVLAAVPEGGFQGRDADYRRCMFERFERPTPPELADDVSDPLAREVLRAYQAYWWHALTAPSERKAQEGVLRQRLVSLLGARAAGDASLDSLEPVLIETLRERGYHALLGVTLPLRELMLWRRQERREFDVVLPEGTQRVPVELLDDFVSPGWSAYGRCQDGSTGGWATRDSLYAVVPAYRDGLDSEQFRVVFLAHETQHFADKRRYPELAPWELEYRAKLTELALAEELGARLLRHFLAAQGDDPQSPHTYANRQVIAALTRRLNGQSPEAAPREALQQAARAELAADSARRRSAP